MQAAVSQLPLQQIPLPSLQAWSSGTGSCLQTFSSQMSVVQSLESSQSACVKQPATGGDGHSFNAPSLPPEAIFKLSGENATSFTRLLCAFNS
jgi:hypothetical protein